MKTRIIHTQIHFQDDWFSVLKPATRYLFIYLFTNSYIGQTGAYKIPERVILLETGATKEEWQEAKELFIKDGKIKVIGEYIFVVNAKKHANYTGPKNENAFNKEFESLPEDVRDTVSIHYGYPIDTPINHKSTIINQKSEIKNNKSETNNNFTEREEKTTDRTKSEGYQKLREMRNRLAVSKSIKGL